MTCKMTAEDREDAMFERWLIAGGPAKAKAEHEALARASLAILEAAGYAVLSAETVRPPFHDVAIIEAVVRKGDKLDLIRWQTFNRGWMRSTGAGWVIFDPPAAPKPLSHAVAKVEF